MNKYLLLLIAAFLSAVPPILLKYYINSGKVNNSMIYLSVIMSILLLIIYIYLFEYYGTSQMYTVVKILSILMVVVVGFLYLREKITVKNLIGIIFAVVALILLTSN
jgi:multidrug transporter EmrE-like cation transporter